MSAGLDAKGMPVAWNHRFAGSSVVARWLPPAFNNGLDPDTTEGAIDLVYALPNMHVEYVRVEPPGIPTAFWRSVGPSHNVFVTESFMDELAAAAKQDPVAYRLALLDKTPRAKAVLDACRGKGGLGTAVARKGRPWRLRSSSPSGPTWRRSPRSRWRRTERFASGAWSARSIAAPSSIPTPCGRRSRARIIFGITAALYGKITVKDGRVEQANFDTYQMLRMNEAPAIEVHIVQSSEPPGGMGEAGTSAIVARRDQCDLCGHWQALAQAAGRHCRVEAAIMKCTPGGETRRTGNRGNLLPYLKFFCKNAFSEKRLPPSGKNRFGQVRGRGHEQFSKSNSPPYRGVVICRTHIQLV